MWPLSLIGKKKPTGRCYICLRSDGFAFVYSPTVGAPCQIVKRISYGDKDKRQKVLSNFVSDHELTHAECSCILLPEDYSIIQLEKPKVPDDEMANASRWLIKDLITFPIDKAAIDVFYAPPMSNQQKKINVVATKLSYIKEIQALVIAAGLKLVEIDISALALNNFMAKLPESDHGVVLLYAGDACSHVIISFKKTLYVEREIKFDSMAETSQSESGDNSRYDSLILEIQRSLDFYQGQFGKSSPAKLYFCPTFNQIPNIATLLSSGLTLPVGLLDINSLIHVEGTIDLELQAYCLSAIGAALGESVGEKLNDK